MIDETRRDAYGNTISEYLEGLPFYLDSEGVRLWSVPATGKSFGFEGGDLVEFVKRCLLHLLRAGGIPVRYADSGPLYWREQTQYGKGKEEIANAIIAEWLAAGGGIPPWGWLWFVNRHVLETEPNIKL